MGAGFFNLVDTARIYQAVVVKSIDAIALALLH